MPNLRRGMMGAAGVSTASPSEGTLWGWGSNEVGSLGDGTETQRNSPVQIGSATDWKILDLDDYGLYGIGEGGNSGQAIAGGKLYSWGRAPSGRGGRGDTVSVCVPTQVGSLSTWSTCTGGYTNWATKTDGTWWFIGGANSDGQAGNPPNDAGSYSSPVQIGSDTFWVKCGGTTYAAYAITNHGSGTAGRLYAIGSGNNGEQGNDSLDSNSLPAQIGTDETWETVAGASNSVCALKTDGSLFTWGANSKGQLGDGTTDTKSSPVQIGTTEWAMVTVSHHGSMGAVKTDGTLWGWGYNGFGELGLGDTTSRCSPVQVGALTDWKLVATPVYCLDAIKTDGTLWTCGRASYGGLANGTTTPNISSPAQVGSDTDWVSVANCQGWQMHGLRSP